MNDFARHLGFVPAPPTVAAADAATFIERMRDIAAYYGETMTHVWPELAADASGLDALLGRFAFQGWGSAVVRTVVWRHVVAPGTPFAETRDYQLYPRHHFPDAPGGPVIWCSLEPDSPGFWCIQIRFARRWWFRYRVREVCIVRSSLPAVIRSTAPIP